MLPQKSLEPLHDGICHIVLRLSRENNSKSTKIVSYRSQGGDRDQNAGTGTGSHDEWPHLAKHLRHLADGEHPRLALLPAAAGTADPREATASGEFQIVEAIEWPRERERTVKEEVLTAT